MPSESDLPITTDSSPASSQGSPLPKGKTVSGEEATRLDKTTTAVAEGLRRDGDGRRVRPARRDLTTGSIPKNLAHLAWPQIGEGVLRVLDQLIDLVWAGRLPGGFRAIAGVGVGQTFTQFGMMARMGLDNATRAMISRAVGTGNIPLANHIALQGLTLTAIYSLLMIATGLFLTEVFLRLIGASAAVQAETAMYMRVQFVGVAAMSYAHASAEALQASGEVIIPFKASTVARVLHIILSPFLIFGWWWFPDLGLPGAAWANLIGQLAGGAINFYALFTGKSRLHLTLRGYRVDYPVLGRILKIGVPASMTGMERAVAQLVLLGLAARFGDVALAAYALTRRAEMLTNFGTMGLGKASGILVGQNLGARRPDRARQSVVWGLVYAIAMQLVLGGLLFVFVVTVVTLFTKEADVVALASVWFRIQVIASVFLAIHMVFMQSFNTAGDTLAPMVITLVAVWGVELPLAWLFSRSLGMGPLGIGYAAIVGMGIRAVFYVPYFFWGRWLRIKVL
ncbi:MAG: MATE family efflux transporter [Chloroflexi bacterium]|nr:MATE family efflux transporter [Chloroflexota bacterium]